MILCADDFGLNDPVSEGILQLADKGKVNAISCLPAAGAASFLAEAEERG